MRVFLKTTGVCLSHVMGIREWATVAHVKQKPAVPANASYYIINLPT